MLRKLERLAYAGIDIDIEVEGFTGGEGYLPGESIGAVEALMDYDG